MRKTFTVDDDSYQRRIRAAASPTPASLGRSHDSLLTQNDSEQVIKFILCLNY